MKIAFGCLGFSTNSVFIQLDPDEHFHHVGTIDNTFEEPEFSIWGIFSRDPLEEERLTKLAEDNKAKIVEEYNRMYEKHGVAINDISKEAWLEGRYGEPLEEDESDEEGL